MMQPTSLDAFYSNKKKFGKRQQVVYDTILKLGCPTDLEITEYLGFKDPNKVRPRRNDLVRLGVVAECEKRVCSISGNKSISWRVVLK